MKLIFRFGMFSFAACIIALALGCATSQAPHSNPASITPPYLLPYLTRLAANSTRASTSPATLLSLTPQVTLPVVVPSQTPLSSTTTVQPATRQLYGYRNAAGGYAFNYPSTWQGNETQSDVAFGLPNGAAVYVHAEPSIAGQTLDEFVKETEELERHDILEARDTSLGGEPAVCQKIVDPGESQLQAYVCFTLHSNRRYAISLTDLAGLPNDQLASVLEEFELLLKSFLLTD